MFVGLAGVIVAVFFAVFVIRIIAMPVYAAREIRNGRPVLGWALAVVSVGVLWVVWDVASGLAHLHPH